MAKMKINFLLMLALTLGACASAESKKSEDAAKEAARLAALAGPSSVEITYVWGRNQPVRRQDPRPTQSWPKLWSIAKFSNKYD